MSQPGTRRKPKPAEKAKTWRDLIVPDPNAPSFEDTMVVGHAAIRQSLWLSQLQWSSALAERAKDLVDTYAQGKAKTSSDTQRRMGSPSGADARRLAATRRKTTAEVLYCHITEHMQPHVAAQKCCTQFRQDLDEGLVDALDCLARSEVCTVGAALTANWNGMYVAAVYSTQRNAVQNSSELKEALADIGSNPGSPNIPSSHNAAKARSRWAFLRDNLSTAAGLSPKAQKLREIFDLVMMVSRAIGPPRPPPPKAADRWERLRKSVVKNADQPLTPSANKLAKVFAEGGEKLREERRRQLQEEEEERERERQRREEAEAARLHDLAMQALTRDVPISPKSATANRRQSLGLRVPTSNRVPSPFRIPIGEEYAQPVEPSPRQAVTYTVDFAADTAGPTNFSRSTSPRLVMDATYFGPAARYSKRPPADTLTQRRITPRPAVVEVRPSQPLRPPPPAYSTLYPVNDRDPARPPVRSVSPPLATIQPPPAARVPSPPRRRLSTTRVVSAQRVRPPPPALPAAPAPPPAAIPAPAPALNPAPPYIVSQQDVSGVEVPALVSPRPPPRTARNLSAEHFPGPVPLSSRQPDDRSAGVRRYLSADPWSAPNYGSSLAPADVPTPRAIQRSKSHGYSLSAAAPPPRTNSSRLLPLPVPGWGGPPAARSASQPLRFNVPGRCLSDVEPGVRPWH